jgi:type II secretory pathway component PulF
MSLYLYEAVDRSGKVVNGAMDAPDEAMVTARLSQMGYQAQWVKPSPRNSAGKRRASAKTAVVTQPLTANLKGATPRENALFFRQFAALVRSGISLYQALDHLQPRTRHPSLAQTVTEMREAARSGGRISDVMERYPRLYAPHVVGTVRAGELGGFLEIALDEIALEYEQEIAFYKGMWLPKALVAQALIAIAVGQPAFPTLFPNAQFLEFLKLVFLRNLPILGLIFLLAHLFLQRMQQPQSRERRDALILKTPVFGSLARQRSLAAFVRMLRRLYAAGIGPMIAWEGAMNVVPNTVIREKLAEALKQIETGNVPMHDAFARTGLFADETEALLATGVVSGQMTQMLDRVAEYYQDSVERAFHHARFWMYRIGISLFILTTGILFIILVKSYFTGIFEFVDREFSMN